MFNKILNRRWALLGAGLMLALGADAQTGSWPDRPIRLIVPGPAGGGIDIFARMIQTPLQIALKQAVVIDNKAGANGIIGIDATAKAAPDGYTIVMAASSAIAINPLLQAKMPYDTQKDLAPVAQIGAAGILLMTNPASGFKSLPDLVRYAKANPGKLTYGSWGNGSTGHLVMEGLKAHYGLDMPHLPYKGTAPVILDLLNNTISVAFTDIAGPIPHIRAGKLVALGVTGSGRGPALPDLPTLTEQGYKFDANGWFGIFAPAGTSPAIVRRLNEEINRVLATEPMRQQFATQNMAPPPIKTVEQFAATVKSDIALWQSLGRTAKLQVD